MLLLLLMKLFSSVRGVRSGVVGMKRKLVVCPERHGKLKKNLVSEVMKQCSDNISCFLTPGHLCKHFRVPWAKQPLRSLNSTLQLWKQDAYYSVLTLPPATTYPRFLTTGRDLLFPSFTKTNTRLFTFVCLDFQFSSNLFVDHLPNSCLNEVKWHDTS